MCVKRVQMNYFLNICRFWILSLLLKEVTCLENCSIIQGSSPSYHQSVCQTTKDAFQDAFTSQIGARCHSDEIWVFCPDPSTQLGHELHLLIGGPTGAGFAVEIVSVHLGVLIFMVISTVTSLSLLAYISIRTHCQCLSMKKKRWSDIELKSQTNDKHQNEHTQL